MHDMTLRSATVGVTLVHYIISRSACEGGRWNPRDGLPTVARRLYSREERRPCRAVVVAACLRVLEVGCVAAEVTAVDLC